MREEEEQRRRGKRGGDKEQGVRATDGELSWRGVVIHFLELVYCLMQLN